MKQFKDIKLCLFDCGGVVYPYSLESFYLCLEKYYPKAKSFHFKWKDLMLGRISVSDFNKDICSLLGVDFDEKKSKELNDSLLKGVGPVYPQTRELISYLKGQNVKIGMLSNALPQLEKTIEGLSFDFDFVFPSYKLNALKPDEMIFKQVQNQTKIPFENMLFIDDKKENVNAASLLGIKALVYNSKTVLNDTRKIMGGKNVRYSCDRGCNCR